MNELYMWLIFQNI